MDAIFESQKRCPDCGETKSLADFPRNRGNRDGRHSYCKPCHNARGSETRERLYGGSRHYHLTRRYGISAAEVDELIRAQNGVCAVCEVRAPEHVDRDHVTGKVRGVLCFGCNGGLGQFQDNIEWMTSGIEYIRRHREVHEPAAPYILSVA